MQNIDTQKEYPVSVEVERLLGHGAAKMLGIIRSHSTKDPENKCFLKQTQIEEVYNCRICTQSKYSAKLINAGLLQISRNEKNGNINFYEVFEENLKLLNNNPEEYAQSLS
jgi:hypothetical protein